MKNKNWTVEFIMPNELKGLVGPTGPIGPIGMPGTIGITVNFLRKTKIKKILDKI